MNVLVSVAAVVTLGVVYVLLPSFVMAYRRLRGFRIVRCPETLRATIVDLDAPRSALSAAAGSGRVRLQGCSRWPAHRDCDQDCMRHLSPDTVACRRNLAV